MNRLKLLTDLSKMSIATLPTYVEVSCRDADLLFVCIYFESFIKKPMPSKDKWKRIVVTRHNLPSHMGGFAYGKFMRSYEITKPYTTLYLTKKEQSLFKGKPLED